jgi:hypothetical protein
MEHFQKLFDSISLQERSDYLFYLLENDEILQEDFLFQYKKESEEIRLLYGGKYNYKVILDKIKEQAEKFRNQLEQLDLENLDWDRYSANDENAPDDYEIAESLAQDDAEVVFKDYRLLLEKDVCYGSLLDIVRELIVIIHGAFLANIHDPDNHLGDPPNEYFILEVGSILLNNQGGLTYRRFTKQDLKNSVDLLFRFNNAFYRGKSIFLEAVSEFLCLVIRGDANARIAWNTIENLHVGLKQVPGLMEHITSQLNDQSLWLEKMESCFLQEYSTSEKLMDYYYRNDKEQFNAKAPLLAEHFEDWCTDFLIDKVEKGTPLHVSLLKRKIWFSGNLSYFGELRSYVDVNELKEFIGTIGSSDIQAKLYSNERMYDELVNLIRKELKGYSYYVRFDFESAIENLLDIRPEVAWSLFEQEIQRKMDLTYRQQRPRDTYQYVARLLHKALSIPGQSEKVRVRIASLFNTRPHLSALKDEFRKAGII